MDSQKFFLVTLLLTLLPIITFAYLLDLRRAKIIKRSVGYIFSRSELILLGLAWVFGIIFIWLAFFQNKIRYPYAVISLILMSLMFISSWSRKGISIVPKMRWYVALVAAMILSIFLGVLINNRSLLLYGTFLLSILMIIVIWSRIFRLFK